jgi:hypothetical protein
LPCFCCGIRKVEEIKAAECEDLREGLLHKDEKKVVKLFVPNTPGYNMSR